MANLYEGCQSKLKIYRIVAFSILLAFSFSPGSQAATKVFKNCTELNKVYPGGVALPNSVNTGGTTKKTPKYDKSLYLANSKSDRDKDGIACEK